MTTTEEPKEIDERIVRIGTNADGNQYRRVTVDGAEFLLEYRERDGTGGRGLWDIYRKSPPGGHLAALEWTEPDLMAKWGLRPDNLLHIANRDLRGGRDETITLIRKVANAAGLPMSLSGSPGDW